MRFPFDKGVIPDTFHGLSLVCTMMFLPALSSIAMMQIALSQIGDQAGQMFNVPFEVENLNRLVLSPVIDGRIDNEEWDSLASSASVQSFMQWEPEALFLAAKLPAEKDLLISLDMLGDGWLVGKNNLELRVTWEDGAPKVSAHILDATDRNAPTFIPAPVTEMTLKSAGIMSADEWSVELRLNPIELPKLKSGRTIGVRVDAIDKESSTGEAYVPRKTSLVTLRWDRGVGVPSGLEWKPEFKYRSVVPGDDIKIRLTFEGQNELSFRRIEMRTEGLASEFTTSTAFPFPHFDKKGRAFVDYKTVVAPLAPTGYRLLNARVTGEDKEAFTLQTSYAISSLVDIDVELPEILPSKSDSQIIRGYVYLRSNSMNRLDGKLTYDVPDDWTVSRAKEHGFTIYHSRGVVRKRIELIAPQNATGLVPVEIKVEIGSVVIHKTAFIVLR